MICITGGSAGGHLTALAGLTANAPEFQPGFEDADTSVAAAVPFYGVYDLTNANGHYYPQLNDWVFEKVLFKRPLVGNETLPLGLADAPDARRRAPSSSSTASATRSSPSATRVTSSRR